MRIVMSASLLALLSLLSLLLPSNSLGCECVVVGGPMTAQRALDAADAVFVGYVASMDVPVVWGPAERSDCSVLVEGKAGNRELCIGRDMTVTFEVVARWKGVGLGRVSVRNPAGRLACRYPFEIGEYYLVYASKRDSGGGLETSTCSRTKQGSAAWTEAEELGPPVSDGFRPGENTGR